MIPRGVDSRSDFPEGFMEKLDQINMSLRDLLIATKAAQGKPSEPEQGDGKAESSHQGIRKGFDVSDSTVIEISDCIYRRDCDRLLEMVDVHAELFLQAEDPESGMTALHVAVLERSRTLADKLLFTFIMMQSVDDETARDFCKRVDKWYGINAWAMAAVSGQCEILDFFNACVPGLRRLEQKNKILCEVMSEKELREVRQLFKRELKKEVFRTSDTPFFGNIFGYLHPWQTLDQSLGPELAEMTSYEFFFHQLLGNQDALHRVQNTEQLLTKIMREAAAENISLVANVLNLQDHSGRTVLHILAVSEIWSFRESAWVRVYYTTDFIRWVIDYFPDLDLNAVDSAGRTLLHIASALRRVDLVKLLVEYPSTNVNATFDFVSGDPDQLLVSDESPPFFHGDMGIVTALHLAVIHNHVEVVQALLDAPTSRDDGPLDINLGCCRQGMFSSKVTPFQLAALKGHIRILQLLLKDSRLRDRGLQGNEMSLSDTPALHYATASFQPWVVKALVESDQINTFATDRDGSTALHYATRHAGSPIGSPDNILDYVTLDHLAQRPCFIPRKEIDQDIIACMDVLMQSGLQMQTKNNEGDPSTLSASSPQGVQKWWLEKMAKETQESKNNLLNAANAVSVTAALVATASFVGPLQPPLGMSANSNLSWLYGYSQVDHLPVQVFLFCNNLSFYLAIASIVTAMLPSWPIPNEGLLQEVRIARRVVQVGVLLLFMSIIFVICAFSSASIAIMPESKWQYKALAVVSTIMGGLTCFFILLLSLLRLLKLIASHSEVAKGISNIADSILLWTPSCEGSPTPKTKSLLSKCKKWMRIIPNVGLGGEPKTLGHTKPLSYAEGVDHAKCLSLTTILKGVRDTIFGKTFDVHESLSLSTLPEKMGTLETLNLSDFSSMIILPKEVGILTSLTTLDLSRCANLIALPKEVGTLISLTTLNLSGCLSLTTLPKEVGTLSCLTTMNLSGCSSLRTLPKTVVNLISLETLDLSMCSILTTLPEAVANLTSLTTLNLSMCSSLIRIPNAMVNLTSLTTLDMFGCSSLTSLPAVVVNLTSLTTLDLSGCMCLMTLPKEVGLLISLTTLNLSGCMCLMTLPKEVGLLISLTTLNLSRCSSMFRLPEELGYLTSLATVNLSSCSRLLELPKALECLIFLTTFDLSGCSRLKTLPEEVRTMTSLLTLHFSECSRLRTLPEAVMNLISLTTLDLSGCSSLTTLPKALGYLTSLATINLSRCFRLRTLPEEVGTLLSLTTLNLSKCSNLTTLLEALGYLTSLATLNLSGCLWLTILPKKVGTLISLTTLDLSRCSSLTTLSDGVGEWTSLINLNLSGCSSLTTLSEKVGKWNFLRTLDLSGCSSLTTLSDGAGEWTSLINLNLSGCSSLKTLSERVGNWIFLRTLDLSECLSLTTLSEGVGNWTSLRTLDLSGCSSLATLPQRLGNLTSLTTLNLAGCSSLTTLPQGLRNLSSLTTFKLSRCCHLLTLPEGLGYLPTLATLDLSECLGLNTLPKAMINLTTLRTLNLSGCASLTTLPEEVGNLISLEAFDLSRCSSLIMLSEALGTLTSLATFNLSGCSRLTRLLEALGNMSSLTSLDLSGCSSLVTLPMDLGRLISLTTLNFSGCSSLISLPEEVSNLIALKTLNLFECSSLKTLPKRLGNWTSLTIMNLSRCSSLITLPEGIDSLTSLTTLDVSRCSSLTTYQTNGAH